MFIYFPILFFNSCGIINAFVYRNFTGSPLGCVEARSCLRPYRRQQCTVVRPFDSNKRVPLCIYATTEIPGSGELEGNAFSPDGGAGSPLSDGTKDGTSQSDGTVEDDEQENWKEYAGIEREAGSLSELSRGSPSEGSADRGSKLNISRRLWKLLMGLLIYRAKYGDYMADPSFVFGDTDEPRLKGYRLGGELDSLLESIKLHDTDIGLYKRLMTDPEKSKNEYATCDIVEAPRLLWLIGFPTATYLRIREDWRKERAGLKGMGFRISRVEMMKGLGSLHKDTKEDTVADPARLDQVKKVVIEYVNDEYKHKRDSMVFNKRQDLPDPSNRARVRPHLLKRIVAELLELKQTKNSSILTQRPTRREIEGGHHYAFYHWTFDDLIECMVLFNDMYMDHNRELLIESEKHGTPFKPITFNILKPEWRVPSDDLWPERFWGFPLGIWLEKLRNGDIDAKQHWLRRDILDHLQFDWGDGLRYLTFTWDKLLLGLLWYINLRGFPIMDMPPHLVVSNAELVAKWGKPEEIQGLKLGYIFYSAMDQLQVLRKYYPQRYGFLEDMGVNYIEQEEIDLGYKPMPHQRFKSISRYLRVSKDGKHLKD